MSAKRRILGLTVAAALASALASAAGSPQALPALESRVTSQPADAIMCVQPINAMTSSHAQADLAADPSAGKNICPEDMVEVSGEYCPAVEQICEKYLSQERDRCERYRSSSRCLGQTRAHHYCMDRYEYPNQKGATPVVAVNWEQAKSACMAQGKRLCTAEEWTLACEGPERLPYPYGYERDKSACNIDRPYIMPDNEAYNNPRTREAEVTRLDQRQVSGASERCVSAFGVYDMTGNVDEWVANENGSLQSAPYDSGLKGGYWAPVRNRCRPMTTDHNRWHHGYQIGFRCCADPGGTESSDSAATAMNQAESRQEAASAS